jgi:hypothetical protein
MTLRKVVPSRLEEARIRHGEYKSDATDGLCGVFRLMGPCATELVILAADTSLPESHGWEHVSVSTERRIPNWIEMSFVKNLFWDAEELVVQFHPPKSAHINLHPNCLHLWRPGDGHIRLPPSNLVG